jgi:hypothetical protein
MAAFKPTVLTLTLVEYPGIEPGVPEDGGFTVHCITIDASTPLLEHRAGFEPAVLLFCRQLHWASLPSVHNFHLVYRFVMDNNNPIVVCFSHIKLVQGYRPILILLSFNTTVFRVPADSDDIDCALSWCTQDFSKTIQLMVPQERLELSRLATLASKTSVSTIPPPGQNFH